MNKTEMKQQTATIVYHDKRIKQIANKIKIENSISTFHSNSTFKTQQTLVKAQDKRTSAANDIELTRVSIFCLEIEVIIY